MQKPSILGLAAAAGIAAFCWTLYRQASQTPLRRPPAPHSQAATNTLRAAGHVATAGSTIEELESHLSSNPTDFRAWTRLAQLLQWHDRAAEAQEAWRRVISLTDDPAPGRRGLSRSRFFNRGMAFRALGQHEQSVAAMAEYRRAISDLALDVAGVNERQLLYQMGWAARIMGDEVSARQAWTRAVEITQSQRDLPLPALYDLACYLALIDEPGRAAKLLRNIAVRGFADPVQAEHDENLDSVRGDPEFPEILAIIRHNADALRNPTGDGE